MTSQPTPNPFAALRQFTRSRAAVEQCELCGQVLPHEHPHLIEPATRRLVCACGACAVLFDGQAGTRFRRVPTTVEFLEDFQLTDGQWEALNLPIGLAFFFASSAAKRMVAMYPSPAGATESLLPLGAWEDLVAGNPSLGDLKADVEAVLVNRIGAVHESFRLPIDECFRLVGLIRTHWHGLSGGPAVWEQLALFTAGLKERCARATGEAPPASSSESALGTTHA